jgi:hypothetical protein
MHLQPKETIVSTDQDTANVAALRSRVFFHISKDNLDYDESKFHPALIQNTDERQKWTVSVLQQLHDLVCKESHNTEHIRRRLH